MRRIIAVATALSFTMIGCGLQEHFYGVWLGLNNDLEISADGTYSIKSDGKTESGKWSFDGFNLIFSGGDETFSCGYDKAIKNHLVLTQAEQEAQGAPCKIPGAFWSVERALASASTTKSFACTINQDARRQQGLFPRSPFFDGSGPLLIAADSKDRIVYLHKEGVQQHFVVVNNGIWKDHIEFMVKFSGKTAEYLDIEEADGAYKLTYSSGTCGSLGCGRMIISTVGTCVKAMH